MGDRSYKHKKNRTDRTRTRTDQDHAFVMWLSFLGALEPPNHTNTRSLVLSVQVVVLVLSVLFFLCLISFPALYYTLLD